MELLDIKQLAIELMDAAKARNLAAFSLETEDFKIKIKAAQPAIVQAVAASPAATPSEAASDIPAPEPEHGTKVTAPLVGTFYSAPAPDAPPYVEVGQQVSKGDTVCIIEAMKTMNEITAPCDGVVSRILVQPGDMVEYKQTLLVIE